MKLVGLFLGLVQVLAANGQNDGNGNNGNNGGNRGPVCASGLLYTQAQCCKTGVVNVADLDCKPACK